MSLPQFALLTLLITASMQSAKADDQSDVLAANKTVEESFSKLDVTAIENTWDHSDGASVIHPSSKNPVIGWQAVQKTYADHPARYQDFKVTMESPHVTISGNTAWVIGTERVLAHRKNGDLLDIAALTTNIFQKRDGKWLLVHHHASRMP
jgi:ketosteroid isomerase-like protein